MLWDQEGVPHKGWRCHDMEDLGEDLDEMDAESRRDFYETCQMCRHEGIRYVHIMEHPDFDGTLRVGQHCAEKMETDYTAAKKRETGMKNRYKRLQNFLKQNWHRNTKGNYTMKYKGYHFTIMPSKYGNSGYGVFFLRTSQWDYNGDRKLTFERAKLLAFDLLEKASRRAEL